jgi:hypothetical protein
MKRRVVTLALLASTTPLVAQWLTLETPGIPRTADGEPDLSAPVPRTAEGRPDLSGLWVPWDVSGDVLDPSKAQEWARALMAESERRFFVGSPRFLCLPSGPAYLTAQGMSGGMRRIVQNPTVIAFLYDDLAYRQIFMDGRELEPNPLPTWMGYSVGRWEGDTLVVESNGYNDKTWLHRRGLAHSEKLRTTERYHRSDFGHLQVEVTYEDPGTFDSPIQAIVEMEFAADEELLETVCNEASETFSHWSSDITDVEETVVEVAPEILARYVGTYRGYWLASLITLEVTLEDGALFLLRTPPYAPTGFAEAENSRLFPRSDTAFECSCGIAFVFVAENGEVTRVNEIHVSGAWPFERAP